MPKQSILIMTDTQRPDMVSCYNPNGIISTPGIDSIANEGIKYINGYTTTPVCGPARSGLFTGVFPHSNGSWTNNQALGKNIKTIGERLTDKGIKCAYIGKWHLDGSDYFGTGKCPDGWDPEYWYDMRTYLDELTPEERVKSRFSSSSLADWFDESFTYAYRCSKRAIDFIEKHKEEDFLLVISYDEPHGPSLCPPKYLEKFIGYSFQNGKKNVYDTLENKPEHQKVWADTVAEKLQPLDGKINNVQGAGLLGCNEFVDNEILKVKNIINKHVPESMVFYTSDHGTHGKSHGLDMKGATMYQENVNIPFVVQWKGHIKPGQTITHPVSHINISATFMDYFCKYIPKTMHGLSLLKHFDNTEVRTNKYIFSEFGRYEQEHDGFGGFQPIRCSMDGRFKLVVNLLTSDEFYDLETDPEELTNLINSSDQNTMAKRDELHDAMLDWMNSTIDPFRGYYWHVRPWRTDAPKPTWEYTAMTRQREEDEIYEPRQLDYNTGIEMESAVRSKDLSPEKKRP